MCIGIPMRVVEGGEFSALCEGRGTMRRLDTMLVGAQPPGTWVLAFLDSAREVLDEERARAINEALDELEAAMRGAFDPARHLPDPPAVHRVFIGESIP